MRKESLKRSANRYLKSDTRGSFKDKQNRAFVIHKMIDDLFTTGDIPSSWSVLNPAYPKHDSALARQQS